MGSVLAKSAKNNSHNRSRGYRISPLLAGAVVLSAVLCLLEIAVYHDFVLRAIVARPSEAISGLVTLQNKVDLIGGFRITFGITAVAVLLEFLVALPFGYFLYRRREFGLACSGWLAAPFAAPLLRVLVETPTPNVR